MPSGNVAEADPRRIVAVVKLFVSLEIARGFLDGMTGFIVLHLAKLVRRFGGEFSFRGERLVPRAVPVAATCATAAARAALAAIVFRRFVFGRF